MSNDASPPIDDIEELISNVELQARVPTGPAERFSGYGTWSLRFASGHRLAFRRFPASSLGLAHTSVWLREPDGRWTIFADVPREYSFARYAGKAITSFITTPIRLSWAGRGLLRVDVPGRLSWEIGLQSTTHTRWCSAALRAVPEWTWRSRSFLNLAERALAGALGGKGVTMRGRMAHRHRFRVAPRAMLAVTESRAILDGVDVGGLQPEAPAGRLSGLCSHGAGLLAVGDVWLERARTSSPRTAPLIARRIARPKALVPLRPA